MVPRRLTASGGICNTQLNPGGLIKWCRNGLLEERSKYMKTFLRKPFLKHTKRVLPAESVIKVGNQGGYTFCRSRMNRKRVKNIVTWQILRASTGKDFTQIAKKEQQLRFRSMILECSKQKEKSVLVSSKVLCKVAVGLWMVEKRMLQSKKTKFKKKAF